MHLKSSNEKSNLISFRLLIHRQISSLANKLLCFFGLSLTVSAVVLIQLQIKSYQSELIDKLDRDKSHIIALALQENIEAIDLRLKQVDDSNEYFNLSYSVLGKTRNSLLSTDYRVSYLGKSYGSIFIHPNFSSFIYSWTLISIILPFLFIVIATVILIKKSTTSLFSSLYTPFSRLQRLSYSLAKGESSKDESFEIREVQEFWCTLSAVVFERNEATTKLIESEKKAVAVRLIQMLAHDVRKPFSLLKVSLELLGSAKTFNEMGKIIPLINKEVTKATTSVSSMLEDILDLEKEREMIITEVSPLSLIEDSMNELANMFPDNRTPFNFSFHHNNLVQADTEKIKRAFSNILGNALQAIRGKGEISICTSRIGNYIEFKLRNTHSYIAEDDCLQIFDSFFTKDKEGGTGLGLAIAKKIIEAHGGKVSVVSNSKDAGFVEFTLTLNSGVTVDSSVNRTISKTLLEIIEKRSLE